MKPETPNHSQETTDFGFKTIPLTEKISAVKSVFNRVAPKYDLMNNVMSMGVHHLWKHEFLNMLNPRENSRLLDVAGGTADISLRFLRKTQTGHATVSDINASMLSEGHDRLVDANMIGRFECVTANAEQLPFPDNHFDYYTISFGIRNVTDRLKALKEAYRVLKPGGRFLCLEFSPTPNSLVKIPYDFYSFKVIPQLGEWIAGDRDSYQYLVESIRMFPSPQHFANLIQEASFKQVQFRSLTGGIVAIHSGWKV
ncbi:MAG: bifunctional demethylmenaquinone methyltransferase/2-methoxy-6-polyprenyl-1,4-benzoquinol methylase UbiE [Alphaproteobacteria bacterium]|nr:bifunctional demethylmenaquinone methyltransferase/2-methoxy-6-polyprenyl-1,4-benzoquinol methylase UbiE [Alphaproteobacteria bacterium]